MPYDQKQARAIYLDIRRKHGEAAAHKFGQEHAQYLKGKSKGVKAGASRYTPDRGRTRRRGRIVGLGVGDGGRQLS
jgi:hypothetical protein